MKKYDNNIYNELLSNANQKLIHQDKTYKSDIIQAFHFVSQFIQNPELNTLVDEINEIIQILSEENIHSHQNIELYKHLVMNLEIIKPIQD